MSFCVKVCCLIIMIQCIDAWELRRPASDFSRHRIVQPIVHNSRTKREITSTRHTDGTHHPEVQLTLDVDSEENLLDLRLKDDIISNGHVLSYQKNGEFVTESPTAAESDFCHYSGKVRGKPGSWVAVSTCHGVRGVIYDGKKTRFIEPAEDKELKSKHYIYDHEDLKSSFQCGNGDDAANSTDSGNLSINKHNRHKRQVNVKLKGPYNENKKTRYVELALVTDYKEFLLNGRDTNKVKHKMVAIANILNSIYAPLNIYIYLVGVEIWSENDMIPLTSNSEMTLDSFNTYRRETLLKRIQNDNAHLITHQTFEGSVVGKAYVGTMCTYERSGGIASYHSSDVIGMVAFTIAHEMGHNFGMEHDHIDCKCHDEYCIMTSSSTSVIPTHWSSCSLAYLLASLERGADYCLRNKPNRLNEFPTCGNGFVEPGEQCDCGFVVNKWKWNPCHACCNPATCTFRNNATCATGTCCDLTTCRPKSAGTVCRSADKECDLPEFCTGDSEYCPKDLYKMDGTPCKNNQSYCAGGLCQSHTDQCKLLWGDAARSSPRKCYESNTMANRNGNCGYDLTTKSYKPCAYEDIMCGRLQCTKYSQSIQFGPKTSPVSTKHFYTYNGMISCDTTEIDFGLEEVDLGLVPDGAKCGENKMCYKQQCISVETVKAKISSKYSSVCPSDCSGHGVCNSEGHCHCEVGFAPPSCELPGPGGSYDSGPATDPSVLKHFAVVMYIIFLGIVPLLLLAALLFYFRKKITKRSYSRWHSGFLSCQCFKPIHLQSSICGLLRFRSNKNVDDFTTTADSNEDVERKVNVHIDEEKIKGTKQNKRKVTIEDIIIINNEELIKQQQFSKEPPKRHFSAEAPQRDEVLNKPDLPKIPPQSKKPEINKRMQTKKFQQTKNSDQTKIYEFGKTELTQKSIEKKGPSLINKIELKTGANITNKLVKTGELSKSPELIKRTETRRPEITVGPKLIKNIEVTKVHTNIAERNGPNVSKMRQLYESR